MPPVFYLEGKHSSTCGYCSDEPGKRSKLAGSFTFGIFPMTDISCSLYMDMLDRGWRRSGQYLYKPDMKRTCCPQYTIRLDAAECHPTRSQRQVSNRWNRFVIEGSKEEKGMDAEQSKSRSSGKSIPPFDLIQSVHAAESSFIHDDSCIPAHRLEVTLEPSSYSDEKYHLYQRYQQDIHQEEVKKRSSFENFLVETPLSNTDAIPYTHSDPPSHLPRKYGSYHQCYRLDGELIAIGVLDILPGCVSSVYFMYDKKWEKYSPGKLSALREMALAREMKQAGLDSMHSLYMGFYVHTCPKMRYKGDYSPSYLLDPEDYTWYPFKECTQLLSQHRYVCFSRPEIFLDGDSGPEKVFPFSENDLKGITVFVPELRARVPVTMSPGWKDEKFRDLISLAVENLGLEISRQVIFLVNLS